MSVLKHREKEVYFDAIAGSIIDDAAKECVEYIAKYDCDIVLVFNGIYIFISKRDTVKSIVSKYYLGLK